MGTLSADLDVTVVEGGVGGGRTSLLLLGMVTGESADGIVVERGGMRLLLLFGMVTGESVDGIVVERGGMRLLLLILLLS